MILPHLLRCEGPRLWRGQLAACHALRVVCLYNGVLRASHLRQTYAMQN